jgi:hypothetical protein
LSRGGAILAALAVAIGVCASTAGAERSPARVLHRNRHARVAIRSHIATWAFDDSCNGGSGASAALVRKWVSYAESDCGPDASKARTNCHAHRHRYCRVMQYLDTDWDYADGSVPLAGIAGDGWWLHEPSPNEGTRIFSDVLGGGFLINQMDGGVRAFFRSYARRHFDADDGLMMDWQSPGLPMELYYSTCGCSSTTEIRSNAKLRHAHELMSAALTHADGKPFMQADNSLPTNPYEPQGLDLLDHATGVDGLVAEGEPEDDGTLDPYYSTLLDQMAYVTTRTPAFVVPLSHGAAGASYQLQSRQVQEATILLAYRPGRVVDWADLEDGSRDLAVWPEEAIYPTGPLESMRAPGGRGCLAGTGRVCSRGGHNSLAVQPGVYRREFAACYLRRAPFGACVAIVNTTRRWVTVRSRWLTRRYRHQVTFVGGDVQSGGRVDVRGAPFRAGSTAVAPHSAMLLAP